MGKILHLITLASLIILTLGTCIMPENAAFWLASGTELVQIIRGLFILILGLLIVTKPPRNTTFRLFISTISTSMLIWTIHEFYNFNLPILDSLVFILASITILISALEHRKMPDTFTGTNYVNY